MANTSPILSGLRLRCGKCGQGKLFSGYLKLNSECPVCGRDMTSADTADGPAFFIGLCMILLPVAKAVLLNLQLHHGAEEVTAADIKDRR